MSSLQALGYNNWFEKNNTRKHQIITRVMSVHKDRFIVNNGEKDIMAKLSGNVFFNANCATEIPTVGDWVYLENDVSKTNSLSIISGFIPRQTVLKRKTVGKVFDYQLIASNIDTAFIIQSANENFNVRRLERYLTMVNEGGINAVVLLSKSDLLSKKELVDTINGIKKVSQDIDIISFSNINGVEVIQDLLEKGKTYCLIGSSGVGKTTLLNNLLDDDRYQTQEVSKKQSKGKHTTTSRELICLNNGSMVIDTPGMRELGNVSVEKGLEETFQDVVELFIYCKFTNCTHQKEQGCAISEAIDCGKLAQSRFDNYLKMKEESELKALSFAKKKRKDKTVSKYVKSSVNKKNKYRHKIEDE